MKCIHNLMGICLIFVFLHEIDCQFNCDNFTEFTCRASGLCLPAVMVCNGFNDCFDNSDEVDPETGECPACPPAYFKCRHRGCRYGVYICNGKDNCGDRSDEADELGVCPPCPRGLFRCANGTGYFGGICIYPNWICNGENECDDGSDEVDPATGSCPTCLTGMFTCADGHCIFPERVCDGTENCKDGSDEKDCNYKSELNDHIFRNEKDTLKKLTF